MFGLLFTQGLPLRHIFSGKTGVGFYERSHQDTVCLWGNHVSISGLHPMH